MKISLRSANLIDLVTSQGRVRFLATHTTKPSWRSRNFEKQRNSRFSVFFLDNHSKFTEVLFTT